MVRKGRGEDAQHPELGECREQARRGGQRQGALERPGRVWSTRSAQHDEGERGAAEGERLADEPAPAQPDQDEGDHHPER